MFFKLVKPSKCYLFCKLSSQILSRDIYASQVSSASNVKSCDNDSHNYFATKLGRRVRKVSVKVTREHMESVRAVLKKHNIDTSSLYYKSRIYQYAPWEIEIKIMLLEELGIVNITTKFLLLLRRRLLLPVNVFKTYLPLRNGEKLADNLFAYTNINCKINRKEIGIHEQQVVKLYIHRCLIHYIHEKIKLNSKQVNRLKNRRDSRFLVQSFRIFAKILEFLHDEIKLSTAKILHHYYTLLSLHPDQLQMIYNLVEEIAKERTQRVVVQYPPIFTHNLEDLKIMISFLKKHVDSLEKISISHMIRIFQMTSDELMRRFDYFSKNSYTQNLLKHPKFINLITLYHSVLPRLRYLEEQNLQYATIQSLTSYAPKYHEDLVTFKSLHTRDMISFFLVNFGNDADEAIKTFKKHIYYRFVPLRSMRKSLDYLNERFPSNIIKENCYAILYNQMDLQAAYEVVMKNPDYRKLPPYQLLTLCLYKIELNNHFTGDPILAPGKYAEWLKENVDEAEQISDTKES